MEETILIGIVEDQAIFRKRLIEHLALFSDMDVAVAAETGEAFLRRLEQSPPRLPHVVLMDIELPGMSGIETTCLLTERHADVDVLMFTVFEDDERIFDSIQAGAAGYLLKDEPIDVIVEAVRELRRGGAPMSASVARRTLEMMRSGSPVRKNGDAQRTPFNLTDREIEILQLLVSGKTTAAIGDALFVSPWTVKTHIRNIYKKMYVSSRAEATRLAIKRNLL